MNKQWIPFGLFILLIIVIVGMTSISINSISNDSLEKERDKLLKERDRIIEKKENALRVINSYGALDVISYNNITASTKYNTTTMNVKIRNEKNTIVKSSDYNIYIKLKDGTIVNFDCIEDLPEQSTTIVRASTIKGAFDNYDIEDVYIKYD